jgi:hypothetical protein
MYTERDTLNKLFLVSDGVHRLRGAVDALYPDETYENMFDFIVEKLGSLEKENVELKGMIKGLKERN